MVLESPNSPRTLKRGNALILALLVMMLGTAIMLWVTQVSAENFRRTDRHLFQEDTFFAAQGAADAIINEMHTHFNQAYGDGTTLAALDFKAWFATKYPLWTVPGPQTPTTHLIPEWTGRSFNAAVINKARITRTDDGTYNTGYYVSFRVEVEAAPTNSDNPADFVTVTKVFNMTNRQRPDTEYAILTENISCTVCHLRVTTLEFAKNVQGEENNNEYKRALIATTKYMNARFDSAASEIHGTFYIAAGARVENHGQAADLSTAINNGNFKMAQLFDAPADEDGFKRNTFREIMNGNNRTGDVITAPVADSSSPMVPGQPLYLKYPGRGDYNLNELFPSPFPDVGDANGTGAKNRTIDQVELDAVSATANGTIKSNFVKIVPPNTNAAYAAGSYTYTDPTLPDTSTPGAQVEIKTGEKNNVILIGTRDNPIEINGNVVIEGDVMIKGYVRGKGLIRATGNIYMPSDVQYRNTIDGKDAQGKDLEVFDAGNSVGYAAGGNIVIGDYISRVNGSGSNYVAGEVEVGKAKPILDGNGNDTGNVENNYANYIAEQLSISNRDELAKTLKKVPAGGGDLNNVGTYGVTNPAYVPGYTPRYYTFYPDTDPYAFIKNGGAARFDTTTKAWITAEAPTGFRDHQYPITSVPTDPTVRDTTNQPRLISVHPNWISPMNMLKLIAKEEAIRKADTNPTYGRNGTPFRIDGLLYTNNAIFSMQRWRSQIENGNGGWSHPESSYKGSMEINGSLIAPDLGLLTAGGHHGQKHALKVNYDRRTRLLINGFEPGLWYGSVDGFARYSGPMVP